MVGCDRCRCPASAAPYMPSHTGCMSGTADLLYCAAHSESQCIGVSSTLPLSWLSESSLACSSHEGIVFSIMRSSPWWLQMRRSPGGQLVIRSLLEQLLLALQVLHSANITHRSVPQALFQRSHSWHLLDVIAEVYLLKVLNSPPLPLGALLARPPPCTRVWCLRL